MQLAPDIIHGPRQNVKFGPYTFRYHGLDVSDPDNPRFVYRVHFYANEDNYWVGYYREDVGGFVLVGFGYGNSFAFIPACEWDRLEICQRCVP